MRPRRSVSRFLAYTLSLLPLAVGPVLAQNENDTVGFKTNHVFEGDPFGENIDILNGGLNLSIPIGPGYQVTKNLKYQLVLAYGSKIWDHTTNQVNADWLNRRGNVGLGFSLHFGRIYRDVETVDTLGPPNCAWYYVSPDGNQHEIGMQTAVNACSAYPELGLTVDTTYYQVEGLGQIVGWDGDSSTAPTLYLISADGRLRYEFDHMIQVYSEDSPLNKDTDVAGTVEGVTTGHNRDFGGWYVTKIYDRNSAHWVQIEYDTTSPGFDHAIKRITDSLGRLIEFTNECAGTPGPCNEVTVPLEKLPPEPVTSYPQRPAVRTSEIILPSFNADLVTTPPTIHTPTYTFQYEYHRIRNGDANAPPCPQTGDDVFCPYSNVLTAILYPTVDGQQYSLTFGYGASGPDDTLVNGQIHTRTLPTGAIFHYTWSRYWWSYGSTIQLYRKQRDMVANDPAPAIWTYTREAIENGTLFSNPKYVTVEDPVGNDTVYHYRASRPEFDPSPDPPPIPPVPDFDDGFAPEWDDGLNTRTEYYEGRGATRRLVRAERREYETDRMIDQNKRSNRNMRSNRQVTVFADDGGRQATVEYRDWNGRGLWKETIETGDDVGGSRKTRTAYRPGGDPSVFDYKEVSDGLRVLSRTDYDYDARSNLAMSIERVMVPPGISTSVDLEPKAGDIVTVYAYNSDNNVIRKEIADDLTGRPWDPTCNCYGISSPKYRIHYGYQTGGYLVSKEFEDASGARPWKAIDRVRDANTGMIYQTRDTPGDSTLVNYSYDVLGRLTRIQPASPEIETEVKYRDLWNTTVRQGAGETYDCGQTDTGDFIMSCYTYDNLGRLTKTQKRAADGRYSYQTTEYNPLGWTTAQSEWVWSTVTAPPKTIFDYGDPATFGQAGFRTSDPFGRVRTVQTADGKKTETSYLGNTTVVTVRGIGTTQQTAPPPPAAPEYVTVDATTRYERDTWGRLAAVVAPMNGGANAFYTYDLRDNLIGVELAEQIGTVTQSRSFEYDALNRLRVSVNPENGAEVVTGYDSIGNVTGRGGCPVGR